MQEPAGHPWVRRMQGGLPRADLPPPDDAHNSTERTVKAEMRATAERNPVASTAPPMFAKNRQPVGERRVAREDKHSPEATAGAGPRPECEPAMSRTVRPSAGSVLGVDAPDRFDRVDRPTGGILGLFPQRSAARG